MKDEIVLGVTGASGSAYFVRLLEVLLAEGRNVHLVLSTSGRTVLEQELGFPAAERDWTPETLFSLVPPYESEPPFGKRLARAIAAGGTPGKVFRYHERDFMAPIASGSFRTRGMVVCPCSGSTLSGIAHAGSANLIQRAADVHLKERRRLILVPRETPLSLIQLDNMRKCVEAGAVLLPAMPGFYHRPTKIGDLIDFVVARICDQLDLDVDLTERWGEEHPARQT